VQGSRWSRGPRAASLPSTSTPWVYVHDQVDVDDHDDGDRGVTGPRRGIDRCAGDVAGLAPDGFRAAREIIVRDPAAGAA